MFGNFFLDFLDRDAPVVRLQDVVENLMRCFQRDRTIEQVGMGDQPIQRPFQFADVGGDLMGEEFHHLHRHIDAGPGCLGFQNGDA